MTTSDGFRVLAVCSGNVCRSPLVELLLSARLAGRAELAVTSAGVIARPGDRMTGEMVAVAARHGVPEQLARAHTAIRLDEHLVAEAGLIIGLTREHRAAAAQLHPRALRRVFTLTELARLLGGLQPEELSGLAPAELVALASERRVLTAGGGPDGAALVARTVADDDIEDPIGRPQSVYDAVGSRIAAAVEVVATALVATRVAVAEASVDRGRRDGPDLSFSFPRA